MTGVTALEMYFENFINKAPDCQQPQEYSQNQCKVVHGIIAVVHEHLDII